MVWRIVGMLSSLAVQNLMTETVESYLDENLI